MADKEFKPYVPADRSMAELTFKAVFLGTVMAVVLGAANAYLGMKVGLTVAATFPAAVDAMAALRPLRGTILEENVARTSASVGEALVAGAIFTIPAFVIAGVWEQIHLYESAMIMLIGGVLGVLFVIMLRRPLVEEAGLPFPESMAAAEIVKAGQGGQTGAKYVFGSMGLAALWEVFVNSRGLYLIKDSAEKFIPFTWKSRIEMLGTTTEYKGGIRFESPGALPALFGVGFIVGTRVSAVVFAGALLGHWFLAPLALFLQPELASRISEGTGWLDVASAVYDNQVKPLAVGAMIVAAFYTLYTLRMQLVSGISKGFAEISAGGGAKAGANRLEIDLNLKRVGMAIIVMSVALFFLYKYFTASWGGSVVLTVLMVLLGFLFTAVAGYLVGLIGSSNNPISGLTLSTLIIAALLMLVLNVTGAAGIAGVLGVAGVICCACGIAGDMMQDLKVGHVLGGTPWRMQVGEIIGVIPAALILPAVLLALDKTYTIGSDQLSAPQANLMALMTKGIVGGEMSWPLVIAGMFFALGLILIKAPSPMLVAVGMYLPFYATAGIFVGGIYRWLMDSALEKKNATRDEKLKAENTGVLISSGLIAGGALTAVVIAFIVLGYNLLGTALPSDPDYVSRMESMGLKADEVPSFLDSARGWLGLGPEPWLGLIAFLGVLLMLVWLPLRAARKNA
ncbi:MAG: oligopeptide transporter, OPT family [Acidobacteriota bacterium]|nr:MAG: oligopeptide transporter, OPT family [Acidobacteriota bacterium]